MTLSLIEVATPVTDALPASIDLISKLGPVGVLGIIAWWFARWLPPFLKEQGERQDRLVAAFQVQADKERKTCDERFDRMLKHSDENRDAILSEIRELRP